MLAGFHKMRQHTNLKDLCRTHGLSVTHTQWMVLHFIYKERSTSIKDIRRTFGITSSAATQLVNELVKKQYVIKKSSTVDRRESVLTLSPTARRGMARVQHAILIHLKRLFSTLTDQEFTQYVRLTKKINGALA